MDSFSDLARRGEAGTAQSLPRQNAEPDFDLIEPAGVGRCVVHTEVGVACQPAIPLRLMTAQVIQDHVELPMRILGHHLVHKIQEFPPAPAGVMPGLDLPSADVETGKQRRSAVSLVLVVEPLQSLPVGKPKIALSALQGL